MPALFDAGNAGVRVLAVRPDDADTRDFLYRPTLAILPQRLLPTRASVVIQDQQLENSCVGFALAAVVNQSLYARAKRPLREDERASERMLYEMARRYDEWQGQHHDGSSLRGALRGWRKHGVTSCERWPYVVDRPGRLTDARARDARSRPLGAFFRLHDEDLSHVQAALVETGAVYASAWITADWAAERLQPATKLSAGLKRIRGGARAEGLHAFAIVGYCSAGFIVQNSWGNVWGTRGLAVLGYDEWRQARQDAWVARPGPTTLDYDGKATLFTGGFAGDASAARSTPGLAGAAANGSLERLIFTIDRGALDREHHGDAPLALLAAQATRALPRNGVKDLVIYAHGGLVSENDALGQARALRAALEARGLLGYSFIWKTGAMETILGLVDSRNDAQGPPTAGWSFGGFGRKMLDGAAQALKKTEQAMLDALHAAQRGVGAAVSPLGRRLWSEMCNRAAGASTPNGGATQFATALIAALDAAMVADPTPYRIHLIGHSAGSIYLAQWYANALKPLLSKRPQITVASVRLMAPAISIADAAKLFYNGSAPAPTVTVHNLDPTFENSDSIHVYPSSLLTYVADHLDSADKRVPILGLMGDLLPAQALFPGMKIHTATGVAHHGDADNLPGDPAPGCLGEVLDAIARG